MRKGNGNRCKGENEHKGKRISQWKKCFSYGNGEETKCIGFLALISMFFVNFKQNFYFKTFLFIYRKVMKVIQSSHVS